MFLKIVFEIIKGTSYTTLFINFHMDSNFTGSKANLPLKVKIDSVQSICINKTIESTLANIENISISDAYVVWRLVLFNKGSNKITQLH